MSKWPCVRSSTVDSPIQFCLSGLCIQSLPQENPKCASSRFPAGRLSLFSTPTFLSRAGLSPLATRCLCPSRSLLDMAISDTGVDVPLVVVTLTGSLLSLLGTAFILICYMILPQKRHIRHALIINLTVAGMLDYSWLGFEIGDEVRKELWLTRVKISSMQRITPARGCGFCL